jgi:integrase
LRNTWELVRDEAELPGLRLHDLSHALASLLASGGLSLPIIGALLGDTTPMTTMRYAHLLDDPLRQATERVGSLWQALSDGTSGEVVPLRQGGQG